MQPDAGTIRPLTRCCAVQEFGRDARSAGMGSEMHLAMARVVPYLALICSACGAPQLSLSTGGSPGWSDPPYRTERDVWLARPGYGRGGLHDPAVAGDKVDALRDRFSSSRLFAPERGVACNRESRVCLEDGDPDRSLTRRYFGRRAARALDQERPRDDDARRTNRSAKRKEG